MLKMNDWSIVTGGSPYTAPEVAGLRLVGLIHGHPIKEDGTRCVTSRIKEIDYKSRLIHTESGSIYSLGPVNEQYKTWAELHCPQYAVLWNV